MENGRKFLAAMRRLDSGVRDLSDAIVYAIEHSEEMGNMRWLEEFHDSVGLLGTFYADANGSQWFPDMTRYEAKLIINQQFLDN